MEPTATPSPAPTATPPPAPTPTPPPPAVLASNIIGFALSDITIAAGTTITWTNQDSAPHTVTSGSQGALTGEFDSGGFSIGESYQRSFNTPGAFPYFCTIHPFMQATVTVQ
ncbi:MAG TPA: amidase [Dehalococcoidia bacterium]|nr:amidase [Dehalococcoidia bacterium]